LTKAKTNDFSAIDPCMYLLSRAFKRQFVIPEFHRFCKEIDTMYEHCKDNNDGMVRNYNNDVNDDIPT
jgi:hypothetical protein